MRPRGRYAPTPSGKIHLGNARTALASWLSIRKQGGDYIWRLEDLDPPRVIAGTAEAAVRDLSWLGLDWDEGGGKEGDFGPYEQSLCFDRYEKSLDKLLSAGRIFPCRYSRKDLKAITIAPHGSNQNTPYPASLRPQNLPVNWLNQLRLDAKNDTNIRFQVNEGKVSFDDLVMGEITENVSDLVGDFVIKRRDGLFAYQLAVVVDDLAMEITEIVRGEDLLASTGRQIQLIEAFGEVPPIYAHLPLVLNAASEKLSKSDKGLSLEELRSAGGSPAQVTGYLAYSLGLIDQPTPCTTKSLIPLFDWHKISRRPWKISENVIQEIINLK